MAPNIIRGILTSDFVSTILAILFIFSVLVLAFVSSYGLQQERDEKKRLISVCIQESVDYRDSKGYDQVDYDILYNQCGGNQ